MNTNPNTNPRQHYQHHHHLNHHGSTLANNVQGYSGNPVQTQMDDRGGSCSGGLSIPNHPHSPMPPSSWVKSSPQAASQNIPLNSINSSNTPSPNCCPSPNNTLLAASGALPAASYGAPNTNSFQQQHSHQFYSETDVGYQSGSTINSKANSTSGRQNQSFNSVNNDMQFYSTENRSNVPESSCFFQQQQQQQQQTNFDCGHENNMAKSSVVCDNNIGSAVGGVSDLQNPNSNSNFYGFYASHSSYHNSNHNNHPSQHQQQSQEYHHNNLNNSSGSVSNSTEGDYSRFHGFNMDNNNPNMQQHRHLQNQMQNTQLSSCQGQGYFGMVGNGRHGHGHQQQQQTHNLPYGHCQNPHQAPFRRNSIESFSTEPGELPYNTKYGCNFNAVGNIPFGDVIKREAGNMDNTVWPASRGDLSINNSSHQHGNGNNQGYFFANNTNSDSNHSHRISDHGNGSSNSNGGFQNHHQQPFQNFKSCSFDTSQSNSIGMEELKTDLHQQLEGTLSKQANSSNPNNNSNGGINSSGPGSAVKQRSLSCSVMTSSYQFSSASADESGGHFNFLDSIENHNSCTSNNISGSSGNTSSGSASINSSRNVNVPVNQNNVTVNQKQNSDPKPSESHHHSSNSSKNNSRTLIASATAVATTSVDIDLDCETMIVENSADSKSHIESNSNSNGMKMKEFQDELKNGSEENICESTVRRSRTPSPVSATSEKGESGMDQDEDITTAQESNSDQKQADAGSGSENQNHIVSNSSSNNDDASEKDTGSLIISTTTGTCGDSSSSGGTSNAELGLGIPEETDNKSSVQSAPSLVDDDGCGNLLLDALDDADVSNSSCSLGLFVNNSNSDSNASLSHLAITETNENDSDENDIDNESCHSGMSSLSGTHKTLSDICTTEFNRHHNTHNHGSRHHHHHHHHEHHGESKISSLSPQKISKRSFSEADKDLVINTTAINVVSFRSSILIPTGWKREIVVSGSNGAKHGSSSHIVFYTSPSGTKLRTWDELKNYICSDGTCKCGLSCPLRLEETFSFDTKVTNSCEAEESSVENVNETTGLETPPRLLCNHKRKIPKSEDSPLISSTRDDLGDCGDHGGGSSKKKRRTNEDVSGTTKIFVPQGSPPISTSMGTSVSVPFSQQSPDTTTQTPQTDMSPASSVSSEQSVFCGSRSTSSTPTPMSSTAAVNSVSVSTATASGKSIHPGKSNATKGKDSNNFGFPWPQIPVSQQQTQATTTSASVLATSPTTTTMTFWPSSNQSNSTSSTISSANTKKPGYQYHLAGKGVTLTKKRANSPCPNIDVRQIPLEHNRPPPRQTHLLIPTSGAPSQTLTNDNPSVSLFPVTTSTASSMENHLLNMNTGYSISPVITTTNSSMTGIPQSMISNTFQFTPQQHLQAATAPINYNNVNILPLPLQFQRISSSPIVSSGASSITAATNTLIHQSLPSSITISMVGGGGASGSVQLPSSSSSSSSNALLNGSGQQPQSVSSGDKSSTEKSPLQLVQDVVDRFQASKGEDNKGDTSSNNDVVIVSSGPSSSPQIVSSEKEKEDNKVVENKKSNQNDLVVGDSIKTDTTTTTSGTNESQKITGNSSISSNCKTGEVTILAVSSASNQNQVTSAPSEPQFTLVSLPLPGASTATTSSLGQLTTVSSAQSVSVQSLVASSPIINCTTSAGVVSVNPTNTLTNHQPIILQQQPTQQDIQTSSFLNTAQAAGNGGNHPIRYPLFQTIQPFFLNSAGGPGSQLIISPQPSAGHAGEQQSFIYEQQPQHQTEHHMQPMLQQTTMVLDPSVCGNPPGSKKKKKRLSKKQQQQQAQLHLQQQLLLQQLQQQAQVQQQVAQAQQQQTIPLTIFPQSFNLGNLGPQSFSLQPMNMNMNMNFFPTPTFLTLPNLILNPADGTLFLQPSAPLHTTQTANQSTTVKLGQFPIAAAPNTVVSAGQPTVQAHHHQQHHTGNIIAPKKDGSMNNSITLTTVNDQMTLIKTGPASADTVSDDSRQNPTPDSSTNDCQLGLNLNPTNSITISLPSLAGSNAINLSNLNQSKKVSVKSRVVSSSSGTTPKRIFTQKQILPKIDSTTPSVENS